MSEDKKGYLICPICFNIKKLEDYDADLHADVKTCDECDKKRSFPIKDKSEILPDSHDINFDNYYIDLEKVYLQKGSTSICATCKAETVNFQGIRICPKCGKQFFIAMYANGKCEGTGTILEVFSKLENIPEIIFQLQKQGEILIFGGISPVSGKKIYFVWQPPTKKQQRGRQRSK